MMWRAPSIRPYLPLLVLTDFVHDEIEAVRDEDAAEKAQRCEFCAVLLAKRSGEPFHGVAAQVEF
jgi:hypothetical protein